MNPTNNEASGMKLPPPMIEQAPNGLAPEAGFPLPPESGRPAAPELARSPVGTPSQGSAVAPAMQVPIPTTTPPIMPVPQRPTTTAAATAQLKARDDADLIEKEWVNKAKQIVERTRDDPYKQTEELTMVKVDYMKKRYNKSIKLNN